MTQIRLVLWKDVRRLGRELGVYAVLLATFAWVAPQTWPGNGPSSFLVLFASLLKLLMAASQFVLITSAVQENRLVGEEQFWITRPYKWPWLLGAKLLFVLLCVVLPFVAMQWAIVHAAGLDPFAAKAGMASSLLHFAMLWLVWMVIASVTESLARAFTFLAALVVVWAGLLQFILSGTDLRMSPPYESSVSGIFFGAVLLGILCYQFARRRTTHSRIAIAVTLAMYLVFVFGYEEQGFGAPVRELIRNHYAVPAKGALTLVFGAGPVPYEERGEDLQMPPKFVEVKLPIRLEGLPGDARIRTPNVAVVVAAKGVHYAMPWQNASVSEDAIGFRLPKDIYDRVAGVETTLHLELVAEEMRPVRVEHVVAADRFRGALGGNCVLFDGKVSCRYAYQAWTPTHVEAVASACDGQGSGITGGGWLLQMSAGTRPDPVVNQIARVQGRVCAGEPLSFTEYGSAQRFRLILDVSGVRLSDYRAPRI